jgi:glycoprotein 2-beta-D-xylosyltransferase
MVSSVRHVHKELRKTKQDDDVFSYERQGNNKTLAQGNTPPYETYETHECQIPFLHSETLDPLDRSGCTFEGKSATERHAIAHCGLRKLRIDTTKISSVAQGGEPLHEVMGQEEDHEYLRYQPGAFVSYASMDMGTYPTESLFYINDILSNTMASQPEEWTHSCNNTVTKATLFIQRYEYVNLYHTMTDLWNTWEVFRRFGPDQSAGVVFMDAHPSGILDDVWTNLFGKFHRANTLFKNMTCFDAAYLIPAGYVSRLGHVQQCTDPSAMGEFVDFVLDKYNLKAVKKVPGRVSLIDRRSFISHPRSSHSQSNFHNVREIDNLEDVRSWIQSRLPKVTSVHILHLHNMTFGEQLRAIRESEVVIGNHGAGLTHLLFLDDNAHLFEFAVGGLDVFGLLHRWKSKVKYQLLPTVEYTVNTEYFESTLLPKLAEIYPLSESQTPIDQDFVNQDLLRQDVANQLPAITDSSRFTVSDVSEQNVESSSSRRLCSIPFLHSDEIYPLQDSSCTVEQTSERFHIHRCSFRRLRIEPTKVTAPMQGGEPLEQVMGQGEEVEYLGYQRGAFVAYSNFTMESGIPSPSSFFVADVLGSVEQADSLEWNQVCAAVVPGATLFIQRYEYVNLYHTMTDLWNTWEVYRKMAPAVSGVVFLDAHPSGNLDDVWKHLFGRFDRAMSYFKETKCFESAYMVPAGYVSRIGHNDQCVDPAVMGEFAEFVLDKYKLKSVQKIPGRVSIIDRKPYVSHPRSKVTESDFHHVRVIDNLEKVSAWVQQRVPGVTSVRILPLHNMTFREQLHAVRESEVLIGNHGAGLTHLLFLDDETHLIEFELYGLSVFRSLHRWKSNVTYHLLRPVEYTMSADTFETNLLPTMLQIYSSS